MKRLAAFLLVAFLLVSCAPQQAPQPIIIQQAPPQQQQQQQVVIIEDDDEVVVPPRSAPAREGWCGALRESRLVPGMYVSVAHYPPERNYLRARPSYDSRLLGKAPPGVRMYLLDGPYCDWGRFIYWHVSIIDKSEVEERTVPLKKLDSVYTAETDYTGLPWLIP